MGCFASFTDEEPGTRLCPGTARPLPLSGCWGHVPHAVPGFRKPVDGGGRAASILPLRPVNEASSLDRISSRLYSALSHHPLQRTLPHSAPQREVGAAVWGWWWAKGAETSVCGLFLDCHRWMGPWVCPSLVKCNLG